MSEEESRDYIPRRLSFWVVCKPWGCTAEMTNGLVVPAPPYQSNLEGEPGPRRNFDRVYRIRKRNKKHSRNGEWSSFIGSREDRRHAQGVDLAPPGGVGSGQGHS